MRGDLLKPAASTQSFYSSQRDQLFWAGQQDQLLNCFGWTPLPKRQAVAPPGSCFRHFLHPGQGDQLPWSVSLSQSTRPATLSSSITLPAEENSYLRQHFPYIGQRSQLLLHIYILTKYKQTKGNMPRRSHLEGITHNAEYKRRLICKKRWGYYI